MWRCIISAFAIKWMWIKLSCEGARSVGEVVKSIAIGAGGLGFDSLAGQIERGVVQALSPGDGPRHSLHASAWYRECNKDLIFSDFARSYWQAEHLQHLPDTTSQQKRSVYFSIASTLNDAGDYRDAITYYNMEMKCTDNLSEVRPLD